MDDLIEALTILRKYGNPNWPTHCEHDVMYVNINHNLVSDKDKDRLEELGFYPDSEVADIFKSFKFGSC